MVLEKEGVGVRVGRGSQRSEVVDVYATLGAKTDESQNRVAEGFASLALEAALGPPSSANTHPDRPDFFLAW